MNSKQIIYDKSDLEKVGEVITNHSITFEEALDLIGAERLEMVNIDDPDLIINGKEYWSDDLDIILEEEYNEKLVRNCPLSELSNEVIAEYVRNAGAWDDILVQPCMQELAHRANVALWEQYMSGKTDDVDVSMTFAEDILSWIGEDKDEEEDWDWDDKVWKAGEVLEDLAKDPCPYKPSDLNYTFYNGWESIAKYIQTLLNVDLGI